MQPVMHWGIEVEQRTESQDIYLDCRQMTLFELRRFAHPSLILFEEDHKMRNVAQLVYGDCVRDRAVELGFKKPRFFRFF